VHGGTTTLDCGMYMVLLFYPSVEYSWQLRHKTVVCLVVLPHQTVECTRCYYVILTVYNYSYQISRSLFYFSSYLSIKRFLLEGRFESIPNKDRNYFLSHHIQTDLSSLLSEEDLQVSPPPLI
jgi:hypothetical protein